MICAAINLQFLQHRPSEFVLRQHAPHRFFDHRLGLFGTHEARRALLEAAGILRVAAIDLVGLFLPGEDDFLRIDHDDVIAGIEEGCVCRLVFAGKDGGDGGRETAEDFAFGVDDKPSRLNVTLLGEIRTHDSPEK